MFFEHVNFYVKILPGKASELLCFEFGTEISRYLIPFASHSLDFLSVQMKAVVPLSFLNIWPRSIQHSDYGDQSALAHSQRY